MLHITNGDSAAGAMKEAGIEGTILSWSDILHDGPVPGGKSLEELSKTRAKFIAGNGWGDLRRIENDFMQRDRCLKEYDMHEEVVFWFEHDLYDQLQLIQLLHWFSSRDIKKTKLSIFFVREFLGMASFEQLRGIYENRFEVTKSQLQLGSEAWQAFCSSDPQKIVEFLDGDTSELPYLHDALVRHLEQFPSLQNGLSRSENQMLKDTAENGTLLIKEAFIASQDSEEAAFLGDWSFASYLLGLSDVDTPLVHFENGNKITKQLLQEKPDDFWNGRIRITSTGEEVLSTRKDWIDIHGIDKWLGGAHLTSDNLFRWSRSNGKITISK